MSKMLEIKLADNQSGYDVIGDYIRRYWEHDAYETVIVSIGLSRDGRVYDHYNEIADPINGCIEFLNDWWEGEKYIRLFGIRSVSAFNVVGGIYEEDIYET